MGEVIYGTQMHFLGGRQILCAFLIANEAIDPMRRSGHIGTLCKMGILLDIHQEMDSRER